MRYELVLKPEARADIKRLSPEVARRVIAKLDRLRDDLAGDVKRLVRYTPGYRLRVGDWRVLFEIEGAQVVVYNVVHRSQAYRD